MGEGSIQRDAKLAELSEQVEDITEYETKGQEQVEDGQSLENKKTAFFSASKIRKMEFLPIVLMIGFVPLIVRLQMYDVAEELRSSGISAISFDLYSYYKSMVILFLDVVMLLFLYRFSKERRTLAPDRETKGILWGVWIFSLLAIISTIFSEYRMLALWGSPGREEGILMVLSYIMIMVYTIFILRDRLEIKVILSAVFFVSSIISILAILGAIFEKNMLFIPPLYYLVMPYDLQGLSLNVDVWNALTFYNPNFVGSFCALMVPMLFAVSRYKCSSFVMRFFSLGLCLSTLWVLFASGSQAGMVGIMLSALFGLYYFTPNLAEKKLLSATVVVMLMAGAVALNYISDGKALYHLKDIFREGIRLISVDKDHIHDPTYGAYLYDVIIEGEVATIRSKDGDFRIVFGQRSAEVEDMDGRSLRGEQEIENKDGTERKYTLLKSPYHSVRMREDYDEDSKIFTIILDQQKRTRFLLNRNEKGEVFLSTWSKRRLDMVIAPHWSFEGKERIGSGRGYIWSRTIPVLKNTILIGYGPDNFLMAFPQGDYLAKNKFYPENPFLVVDKPHNMYLQWGVNEGVVATVALLFSLGYYLVSSMKLYRRKREYTLPELFGIGCMLSVIGYMGAGFFNDSVVSVAPIFWSFFGAGIAVNVLVRRELVDRI